MLNSNQKVDDILIKEALLGNQSSFKQLYDKYKVALFSICLRYMSDRDKAEDMLQESFIKIFKELAQYNCEKAGFYAWASKVCVNTNLEQLRKKSIKIEDLEDSIIAHKMEEQYDVLSKMELDEVMLEILKMPVGYRTVFNMYYIEGYTHKEIAERLGITESTSKTQLMKSKKYLRFTYNEDFEVMSS